MCTNSEGDLVREKMLSDLSTHLSICFTDHREDYVGIKSIKADIMYKKLKTIKWSKQ